MHRLIQTECPDCHAMLAEHERRCDNCGSAAIVDLPWFDQITRERGSWLVAGVLAVVVVTLLVIDNLFGTSLTTDLGQLFKAKP
jgi:hypothetical protein